MSVRLAVLLALVASAACRDPVLRRAERDPDWCPTPEEVRDTYVWLICRKDVECGTNAFYETIEDCEARLEGWEGFSSECLDRCQIPECLLAYEETYPLCTDQLLGEACAVYSEDACG